MSELKIITSVGTIIIPEGRLLEIRGANISIKCDESGAFEISQGKPQAAQQEIRSQTPSPGDVMPDGSICGGISPENDKPFFVTAEDAPELMPHWDAVAYACELRAHGHDDWALPTIDELNVLFTNRRCGALAGTFNETGSFPAGYYWSSSEYSSGDARYQRFSDGGQSGYGKYGGLAVRCVRR